MAGKTSQGVTISMGGTLIGGVTDFTGPEGSASVIDVTDLDSTAKEKLMGVKDEGQYTFSINFDPTNTGHLAIAAARAAGEMQDFEIDLGAATPMTFDAYVLGFSIEGGVDAPLTGSVTCEITGAVTWPTAA